MVKNKLVGRHCTELQLTHRSHALLENREGGVRAISFPPLGITGPATGSCQRQMRTERASFTRHAQFRETFVNSARQFGQRRTCMDADPEHTGCFKGGKESVTRHASFYGMTLYCMKPLRDGLDLLGLLLADELQRDVQGLGPHPTGLRREAADAFEKARDSGADFFSEIDADEYAHDLKERSADHFQGLLRGKLADAGAVAGKIALDHLRALFAGERDVDKAHRL